MKYKVNSEFFCSYFYHASMAESKAARSHVEANGVCLEGIYSSMAAVVLLQGALESYINFLIHSNGLGCRSGLVGTKQRELSGVGIKEKWRNLPTLVSGVRFQEDERPYTDFVKLVDLRNDLVHFKAERFSCEIDIPAGCETLEQVRQFVGQPGVLADHVLYDILAFGLAGPKVVRDMIETLHSILGSAPPTFLESEEILTIERIH